VTVVGEGSVDVARQLFTDEENPQFEAGGSWASEEKINIFIHSKMPAQQLIRSQLPSLHTMLMVLARDEVLEKQAESSVLGDANVAAQI